MRLRARSGESVPLQRGFALIALLALAALISAFLIASALNLTGAGNSNEREDRSMSALRKAKAALIAYAANEQWQLYKGQATDQPGGLPCPDTNDNGTSQLSCPNAVDRIGRLPYMTIGGDDLRDASGERLWYALSSNFRRLSGTTIINSDTQGLLTVTGAAPASNVVAVVIAPGQALSGQDRIAQHNDPAAYLEGVTASTPNYGFNTVAMPSDTANDRLLVITQAELMAAVEPVVAARIERDVKPLFQDYFGKWGSYPFAVPFVAPPVGQSSYQGAPSQTKGLLPLTNTPNWFTWASATVTDIVGSGTGRYYGTTNTISPNPTTCTIGSSPLKATCTINYLDGCCGSNQDRPDIKLEIVLANASMAFADTPSMLAPADSNIVMLDHDGNPLSTTSFGQWSASGSPQNPPTLSFAARADGRGVVTYTGRLQNAGDTHGTVTITVPLPAPSYLPRLTNTSPTIPNISWFTSNQWYRQTYYAISDGFAPGGVGSCSPPVPTSPACLTVNNLPAPTNNKQAILVFFGRALDGQTRPGVPPGVLANYLEGQNSTPADLIFEHRAGTATTINDRVVVISP